MAVAIGPGECFPLAEVVGVRPPAHAYEAEEDTFCYEVKAAVVAELARRSRRLHHDFDDVRRQADDLMHGRAPGIVQLAEECCCRL